MKLIKYPKTAQFAQSIRDISHAISYIGSDDEGNPIYNNLSKPILKFIGTVKIHGTNGGVSFDYKNGLNVQSRKNVLSITKDNFGFALFVERNKDFFKSTIYKLSKDNNIDLNIYTITIFGEWAGKGIQKGVGISEIDKSFFVFGSKVSKIDDDEFKSYWVNHGDIRDIDNKIYNILDFKTFEIEIDFNNPKLISNKLLEMTKSVGDECPVAKELGSIGIGEGIVWISNFKGIRHCFKVKDDRHAGKSNIKRFKKVDIVKLQKIQDVTNKVTPIWRLDQFLTETFDLNQGGYLDIKKMGDFIRNVIKDIMEEDIDIIIENDLEPKDINKHISTICRQYFFEKQNEF